MTDEPLTIQDLRAILRRENQQKTRTYLMASIAIFALIAFVATAFVFLNAIGQVQTVSDRTDCSRRYTAILQKADRELAVAGWAQADRLGSALFNNATQGQRSTPEEIAAFGAGSTALHQAAGHVKDLPNIDEAVDHGFTLHHKHYPACP